MPVCYLQCSREDDVVHLLFCCVMPRVNSSLVEVDRVTRKMTRYCAVCCKVSHLVAILSGPCTGTVGGGLA